MPKIVLKKGDEVIQIFRLEAKNLRVGSDWLADVRIDDWTVGREEALIWPKGTSFFIKGTGAFPQVIVNGAEVSGERVLADGDEIKVGPYTLVFNRLPEELEASAPASPVLAPASQPEIPALKGMEAAEEFEPPTSRVAQTSVPPPKVSTPARVEPRTPPPQPAPAFRDFASEKTMIASVPDRTKVSDAFEIPGAAGEYYLLAVWGPLAGRRFPIKPGETKIGRDKETNQIVVREDEQGELDTSISRRHASFYWSQFLSPVGAEPEFSVLDVGSKLGVMVNGKKIKPEKGIPIRAGDEIGILSEKDPSIFRLSSSVRPEDFVPPRFGKEPQKNPWWTQKKIWIIGGILILLPFLVWMVLR